LQASGKPVDLSKLAATPGEITADAMAAMAAHDRADAARERREAEDRATRRQEQREAALTAEHARLVATVTTRPRVPCSSGCWRSRTP
jgi:hypothetical protein